MASQTVLEDMYNITKNGYSTGSERIDGFIIGLATMLLIRNAELVVIDLLTLFFGDPKQKVSFRVLRTWQMLNLNSILSLLSGFDSDIPCSRFQLLRHPFRPQATSRACRFKVSKGSFASLLFVAVLFGKLLVLSAEIAIIAFLIPTDTLHTDPGGLALQWRDVTISESDLRNLDTCMLMTKSNFLFDFAQIALCTRVSEPPDVELMPQNWAPNGKLRIERMFVPPESLSAAGAAMGEVGVICLPPLSETFTTSLQEGQLPVSSRQVGQDFRPNVIFSNQYDIGELSIEGTGVYMGTDGFFYNARGGVSPIFTSRQGMLRLSFANWSSTAITDLSIPLPTVNGKLLWAFDGGVPGRNDFVVCPKALDEIIRVAGTLNLEIMLDILRLATKVTRSSSFSAPYTTLERNSSVKGFDIGISKRFAIEPKWILLTAALTVLFSIATSRLNSTEVVMGRVYREQNLMRCSCSPIFLDEEKVVEASLYKNNLKYHWGKKPDDEWTKVEEMQFIEDAILT